RVCFFGSSFGRTRLSTGAKERGHRRLCISCRDSLIRIWKRGDYNAHPVKIRAVRFSDNIRDNRVISCHLFTFGGDDLTKGFVCVGYCPPDLTSQITTVGGRRHGAEPHSLFAIATEEASPPLFLVLN